MKDTECDSVEKTISSNEIKNRQIIKQALDQGEINQEAADYLVSVYSNSMHWFRQVFFILGACLGAPKAGVMEYDYKKASVIDRPVKIANIAPFSPYMVHHRLDNDPMRNQFFENNNGSNIDLSVSSIVSVIIGAQKSVHRSIEKITKKYYSRYVDTIVSETEKVLHKYDKEASSDAIAKKIRTAFSKKFITDASETVLSIIGHGHEKISVELVRELDKIKKPHLALNDVWRVKCLFDMVPQARTFIDNLYKMSPDQVLDIRDAFYKFDQPRNYRDAKIIVNLSKEPGHVVPMEIICQTRIFFGFDNVTHEVYEGVRKNEHLNLEKNQERISALNEDGVRKYNVMISSSLDDLFERVGWNILYNQYSPESMFEGFPVIRAQHYPDKIIETILSKIDNAVQNEIFKYEDAPFDLSQYEEIEIFRWMARFILISAIPYQTGGWKVPGEGVSVNLFNFVMNELHRYYKKQ